MTILNCTVGADRSFAVVSVDSLAGAKAVPGLAISTDADEAVRATFKGDGAPPSGEALFAASKIWSFPHLRLVMAGIGSWRTISAVAARLAMTTPGTIGIAQLAPHVPAQLREIAKAHLEDAFIIVLAGWVPRAGMATVIESSHVRAFCWQSADDFQPVNLAGSHFLHPAADTDAVDYPAIADAWEPAALGDEAERFHRLLLANQLRAYRAGKFAAGVVIGGPLTIARLDARGILLQTLEEEALDAPAAGTA